MENKENRIGCSGFFARLLPFRRQPDYSDLPTEVAEQMRWLDDHPESDDLSGGYQAVMLKQGRPRRLNKDDLQIVK